MSVFPLHFSTDVNNKFTTIRQRVSVLSFLQLLLASIVLAVLAILTFDATKLFKVGEDIGLETLKKAYVIVRYVSYFGAISYAVMCSVNGKITELFKVYEKYDFENMHDKTFSKQSIKPLFNVSLLLCILFICFMSNHVHYLLSPDLYDIEPLYISDLFLNFSLEHRIVLYIGHVIGASVQVTFVCLFVGLAHKIRQALEINLKHLKTVTLKEEIDHEVEFDSILFYCKRYNTLVSLQITTDSIFSTFNGFLFTDVVLNTCLCGYISTDPLVSDVHFRVCVVNIVFSAILPLTVMTILGTFVMEASCP